MKNKKGFTLIELLAVIVILGILMLIAIPSVTKYIDSSKRETYIKSINNMVDVVRYGVISETGKYSMKDSQRKIFNLTEIELEKGSNKSPYGNLDSTYSYVEVTKNANSYTYKVQVKDDAGYCVALTNIDDLTKSAITQCDDTVMSEPHQEYSIGDTINFAGSKWYVIKDSTSKDDYVTVMKEKVLTNTELERYAARPVQNVISYYWSDTCHDKNNYEYTDSNDTGCSGHNDYEGSKVKEFLEGTYINKLGETNLKEIDGYKIRLITLSELQELGYDKTLSSISGPTYAYSSTVPQWVYQNFGEEISGSNVAGYWTMSVNPKHSYSVWRVHINKNTTNIYVQQLSGVRPVINLLKNSIN